MVIRVPFVCGRSQGFGTTGSAQRRVSARPRPPPDKKPARTGTRIGVLALPGVWLACFAVCVLDSATFRSDPCLLCREDAYTWDFFHMSRQPESVGSQRLLHRNNL